MHILDGHIHSAIGEIEQAELLERMRLAGVSGGVIISNPPSAYRATEPPVTAKRRMEEAIAWTRDAPELFPFFWIDPTEPGALEQVEMAVAAGAAGFKVICNAFDPGDPRAMPVYRAIAQAGKPILFHSGILWDGTSSSVHCRPVLFEALLEVDGLRFALAHVSWPWCDECIAVYSKFLNAIRRRRLNIEMFIDLTPGTPLIFRQEVLTKLLTVGYDIKRNLIFGTDCSASRYNTESASLWIERDIGIYRLLNLEQQVIEDIFANNLMRFLGKG